MNATMTEVQRVAELLEKARDAAASAAMWLHDVGALCNADANGEALEKMEAAQLVGLAHVMRFDVEALVEAADEIEKELLEQFHIAESESRDRIDA